MNLLRLKAYLKPFIGGVLLSLFLLFVQAMSDLNLPNLMSDLVNIGIQQSGVEEAAPGALSVQGFDFVSLFASSAGREVLEGAYARTSSSALDRRGVPYSKTYPAAQGELYVLSALSAQELARVEEAVGRAVWAFINVSSSLSSPGEEREAKAELDMGALYELAPLFSALPAEVFEAAQSYAAGLDASLVSQSGIALSKAAYAELGVDIGAVQTRYILRAGLKMLAVALIGGAATVLVSLLSSRVASGLAKNLREAVFAKVSSFSGREFDRFSTASLITRSTNDISQVQMFVGMALRMLFFAPIMGVGGLIMALRTSPSMSWTIATAIGVLFVLLLIVYFVAVPKFKIIQKLIDRLNLVSRENLSGLMVTRAFGTQEYETARFNRANDELKDTNLFVFRVMATMNPAMNLLMNGFSLLIIWVGAHRIATASIQVGDMLAFIQYAMHVVMSFLMIAMMFVFLPRAAVSAERIAEVLETDPAIKDPETPVPFDQEKKGLLCFENVSFRYDNAEENAVCNISFTARPGETTAIIGATGSGKSTLASLALRFYDVTEGRITLDGADVRHVRQEDLRAKIGYVPQKGTLLSGTVASNLKYGTPEAGEEDLRLAAQIAQAEEFISAKEGGYDSEISQGGTNVSGGQKQRLSIARALVKKPDVFIFDDSFSALDFKTDSALRKALREHTGGSTMLVVAQRVSTIMNAEQIIVLDEGKIVGTGTHGELMKSCPEYSEIALSQLS